MGGAAERVTVGEVLVPLRRFDPQTRVAAWLTFMSSARKHVSRTDLIAFNSAERSEEIRKAIAASASRDHQSVYADAARRFYIPHLTADFAHVHINDFYERHTMASSYASAADGTEGFTRVDTTRLAAVLERNPISLLALRNIISYTRDELANSTELVARATGFKPVTAGKIDGLERRRSGPTPPQAELLAETINRAVSWTLHPPAPDGMKLKQDTFDLQHGWESVRQTSTEAGSFYIDILHLRHSGGAYRQLLDATSTQRGDVLEDAVEDLLIQNNILFIRTGRNNQSEIEAKFGVKVTPAPDFVITDADGTIRALIECKIAGSQGVPRDKAARFSLLRDEAIRLGGLPFFAVLDGLGWKRVNDGLGPVIRDTDSRVFSLSNIEDMLEMSPFRELTGR